MNIKIKITILGFILIIFDQLSKQLTLLLPQPLKLTLVTIQASRNPAAIFNLPTPNPLVAAISFIILGLLIYYLYRTLSSNRTINKLGFEYSLKIMALVMIVSGGLSNLLDRLIYAGVTDILTIGTLAFNLADIFIALGTISFLIITLIPKPTINNSTI